MNLQKELLRAIHRLNLCFNVKLKLTIKIYSGLRNIPWKRKNLHRKYKIISTQRFLNLMGKCLNQQYFIFLVEVFVQWLSFLRQFSSSVIVKSTIIEMLTLFLKIGIKIYQWMLLFQMYQDFNLNQGN